MDPPKQAAGQQTDNLPQLEILNPSAPHSFSAPSKCINEGPDVARFLTSKAYRDIGVFVMQLNRALCPRKSPSGPSKTFPLVGGSRQDAAAVRSLRELLDRTAKFIDDAPPDPGPRRFGNISFRKWYQLLEDNVDALLKEFVSADIINFGTSGDTAAQHSGASGEGNQSPRAINELRAYFLGAFGSPQRLDYGTGHELSFLAFLGCLWKLGAFKDGVQGGEIERSIVLGVFEP